MLVHRFQHDQSILALATTDAHIYAGTQGGEILVGMLNANVFAVALTILGLLSADLPAHSRASCTQWKRPCIVILAGQAVALLECSRSICQCKHYLLTEMLAVDTNQKSGLGAGLLQAPCINILCLRYRRYLLHCLLFHTRNSLPWLSKHINPGTSCNDRPTGQELTCLVVQSERLRVEASTKPRLSPVSTTRPLL